MIAATKKYLSWAIKLTIAFAAILFTWQKLSNEKNITKFLFIIQHLNTNPVILVLLAVVVLMFLNWFSEAYKWQLLIYKAEPISFYTSVQSVFSGLSVGIITPNRIGDYGTRILFLRPRMRVFGLVALGIGVYAQFVFTNIIGTVAALIFLHYYIHISAYLWAIAAVALIIYCVVLVLLCFNLRVINRFFLSFKFFKRFERFFSLLNDFETSRLLKLWAISLFKIIILVTQYYLIIHLLIPGISFWQVALMILLLFSVQTFAPTIELLDLGVRGASAIYFFSFVSHQDIAILLSTGLIWLINLILPAAIGLIFVFQLNIFEQTKD